MPILNNAAGASRPVQTLTDCEKRYLRFVAVGKTADVIAAISGLPETDINSTLAEAEQKLGARNRLHAVSMALQHGLLEQNDRVES